MSKSLNGRLETLQLIATRGPAEVVYGGTGFIRPNQWISNGIIKDFLERGLIEQEGRPGIRNSKRDRDAGRGFRE